MDAEQDQRLMRHALRLAARGVGHTSPNPVVGCLIVQTQRAGHAPLPHIVGKGFHQRAGEPHAEVLALRQATQHARGATVYVTLEPCSHHGRTPPCADALIQADVARVVVAMQDPNPRVAGQGLEKLRQAGIEITVGLCAEEAATLNQPFITWITQGRPMITLKMAASLDGKTATRTGESQWITGPLARQYVHRMRSRHDAVMVGVDTVLADNPRLNCRLSSQGRVPFRDPIRLVVDSQLRTPLHAAILTASTTAPLWIATTERAPHARRQAMEKAGVPLMFCQTTASGRVNLDDMMRQMGKKGVLSILSEAGGTLSAALVDAKLADRLALFLAPKLIGGQMAAGLLQGEGIDRLTNARQLTKLRIITVGDDLLLEGALG